MLNLTQEWVDKAEGDFASAGREVRARKSPNYDSACFHSQQMAEKYLKAILQAHQQPIPRTHNLLNLLRLCLPFTPALALYQDILGQLDLYSVQYRYPGESVDKDEARSAYKSAKKLREFIHTLSFLGL